VLDDRREDNVFVQHSGNCTYHEKWKCYNAQNFRRENAAFFFRRGIDMRQRNKFTVHAYMGMRKDLVKNPVSV
jgi:hypothetical protein